MGGCQPVPSGRQAGLTLLVQSWAYNNAVTFLLFKVEPVWYYHERIEQQIGLPSSTFVSKGPLDTDEMKIQQFLFFLSLNRLEDKNQPNIVSGLRAG